MIAVPALMAALAGCAMSPELPVAAAVKPAPTVAYGPPVPEVLAPEKPVRTARIEKGGGLYKVGKPYQVAGRWYVPREEPDYDKTGPASWFGAGFHGRLTANGEIFDMETLTAAHPTLPMPSYVSVTNLANGRTILVRVNNRGPFTRERIIDLSRRAARELDMEKNGTGTVRVRYVGPAPLDGNDSREREFLAAQSWSKGGAQVATSGEPVPAARMSAKPKRAPVPSVASLRESTSE